MKVSGQIPWNVTPICETSQIYCLMGRRPMKDVLGNHLKDNHSVWFTDWVSPCNCEGPVKNPSIWKESLPWIVSRIRIVRGRNLEGWRTDRRPWGVRDDGRIGNLLEKTQCERGDISPKRRIYFSSRRWTNQTSWRRSRPENIHLGTAASNSRRKSPWLSWRIRRVSSTTSRLTSGSRWSDKRLLVHVRKLHIPPSRWTPSQTLLAERRIIPYSTDVHWRVQNYSYEFGCQARSLHRWLLEYRWVKRLVWPLDRFHTIYPIGRKTSWRIYVVRGEINEKSAYVQARSSMARTLEVNGKARQADGEAKVVEWKAPSGESTKIARDLFHRPGGYGIQRNHQECS